MKNYTINKWWAVNTLKTEKDNKKKCYYQSWSDAQQKKMEKGYYHFDSTCLTLGLNHWIGLSLFCFWKEDHFSFGELWIYLSSTYSSDSVRQLKDFTANE